MLTLLIITSGELCLNTKNHLTVPPRRTGQALSQQYNVVIRQQSSSTLYTASYFVASVMLYVSDNYSRFVSFPNATHASLA